jgi:hypothetical protein
VAASPWKEPLIDELSVVVAMKVPLSTVAGRNWMVLAAYFPAPFHLNEPVAPTAGATQLFVVFEMIVPLPEVTPDVPVQLVSVTFCVAVAGDVPVNRYAGLSFVLPVMVQ